MVRAGVTVLGNLSIDYVDHGPPTAGGCPTFARLALAESGEQGRIVVRAAAADLPLFSDMLASTPVPVTVLPAPSTSSFSLVYGGNARAMTVERIGPTWSRDDIRAAHVDSTWVHVAPLLRSDFPAEVLAELAAGGHLISYDGQGLVRASTLGPLAVDHDFGPALLAHLQVLNISEDEAAMVFGGTVDASSVADFGVPEVLVTRGVEGCDVYVHGVPTHVPVAWVVEGVQTTGAGDMFIVSYVVARSQGRQPVAAAAEASRFVAEQLQARSGNDQQPRLPD